MDTMSNITSYRSRQLAADNLDSAGRRRNSDRTGIDRMSRPLREVAAQQGAALKRIGSTGARDARLAEMQAKVEQVRTALAAPAPVARPAVASVGERPTYKQIDARAAEVPVGFYCLPRTRPSSTGSTVTFFKVHKFRGGHRIVQLVGSVGDYTERTLTVNEQWAALGHILENIAGAASLYGQEAKECGFCRGQGRHSPLTHERSRAAGYGQTCADKHGLPW